MQRLQELRSLVLVDTSNAGRLTTDNDPNQDARADLETLRGLIATGLALSVDGPALTKQTLAGALALDADALRLQSLRFAIEPLFFEVNVLNQPTDRARTVSTPANVLSLYYQFSPGSTRGTLVDLAS